MILCSGEDKGRKREGEVGGKGGGGIHKAFHYNTKQPQAFPRGDSMKVT